MRILSREKGTIDFGNTSVSFWTKVRDAEVFISRLYELTRKTLLDIIFSKIF